MSERAIRVLVADDEEPARRRILDLLRRVPGIGAVTEAADGRTAVERIASASPDLVFLDVQMPELDGLGVLDAVGSAPDAPLVVFVTAYDRHAIRAFEADALDYLLKPFSDERFEATMARARSRLDERGARTLGKHLAEWIGGTSGRGPHLDRLVVKSGGRVRFVDVADLDWIEAAGAYVSLHAGGQEVVHRASLTALEARLDPRRFVRIHRSAIVNVDRIQHLEAASHGEFEVVLRSGDRLRLSRTHRPRLEERLGQSL
jgi:two-component system LytT family response regulator